MLETTVLQAGSQPAGMIQLLGVDGLLTHDDRYQVDDAVEEVGALYGWMARVRGLDEEFVNLQRQGQLALFPSCRGQEAAQIGSAAALQAGDWVFPQYREHGVLLYRGVDPVELGSIWRGSQLGSAQMIQRGCAPLSVPIATHALHAVGWALGARFDGSDDVAVAYIGDGATSEGDAHEAFNVAAVYEAPCIFFVQNNQWAISVPIERQTRSDTIAGKASAYGMPGVRCDGNDLLATLAVTREAVRRARSGGGPTLIEAVTYRIGPHTTSDDPSRYRGADEVASWTARDPLDRVQRYLKEQGWWADTWAADLDEEIASARQALRDGIYDQPDPPATSVFDHVFCGPDPEMDRQRAELAAEISSGR